MTESSVKVEKNQFEDSDTEDCDNDDLIVFQIGMEKVNVFYSQLSKYSKYIRDKYLFSDVVSTFSIEIEKIEEKIKIDSENMVFFFRLLEQNFNITDNVTLTYKSCIDLLKLADFLEVKKLSIQINKYLKKRNIDVDFLIQIIQYNMINNKDCNINDYKNQINTQMEDVLINKIEESLQNDKFSTLPISIIYRIIKKSSVKGINSDLLYDFIKKSFNKFCVLFEFLDLQTISENRLEEMINIYSESDSKTKDFFSYMKCQLDFIKKLKEQLNNKESSQIQIETEKKEINDRLKRSNDENVVLQNRINELTT